MARREDDSARQEAGRDGERVKLTQRMVDSLKAGDVVVWDGGDGGVKGFGVRVKTSGAKSFVVQYRNEHRQSRRYTIGSASVLKVEAAREKAKKLLAGVTDGEDPAAKKAARLNPTTFKPIAERFIEEYAKPRNRDWKNVERIFKKHVTPKWGSRPITSIERRDVRELLRAVANGAGPIAANRTLAAVRKLFAWAAGEDLVSASPVVGIAPPAPENRRDRVLGDGEIRELWTGFETVPVFGDAFGMMLVTAQRRTEVATMRWADLDLSDRDNAIWTIPAEMNKAGREHVVPLTGMALEILDRMAARQESRMPRPENVFTTAGRAAISGFSKSKRVVDGVVLARRREAAKEAGGDPDKVEAMEGWRLHDLRRTAATNLVRFGADRFIVARVLNHADPSVTGRYDRHLYLREKRLALEKWDRGLAGILDPGGAGNVVQLREAAS